VSLTDHLEGAVPGGVATRATDLLGFAHDASHYLLVPQAVVAPRSAEQVAALLRTSAEHGVPLTFRSGGTSLSGQGVTDGVLVDVRRHFRDVQVPDDGARVRVQPGATVRAVNARLARYGRKLGPDPASEVACTIGGVVANNSSGMACGTELNSYATLDSLVLVLPSGTVLDTGAPDADERLRALEPALWQGLSWLRDRVRADPASVATVRRLYAIKNTMGYGLNSFLDHTRPVDVLAHLVVGSEGTLAFVAEAVFRTVPAHPHAATGLLLFDDLAGATGSLPALVDAGFATIELLDATSLRVAQRDAGASPELRGLRVTEHAALLVEHQQADPGSLGELVAASPVLFGSLPLAAPGVLSADAAARASLWHIRKGLYTAVAGARPSGTTALLEDVAVPVEQLLPTCEGLTDLFDRHGYEGSVIFGHAKHGNVHFMLNERFDDPSSVQRYLDFTDAMVDLVLDHGGTLKAEHGTGRIMAPYVRRQVGDELYAVMQEVKRLLDPTGVLNPGVLLEEDPATTIAHLKTAPTVEAEVDRCVECGYCEPVCPSADLTTSPRRRIALRRETARARERGDDQLLTQLEAEQGYDVVDTCAVDGLCQTACPVLINTGDLVRRLRAEQRTGLGGAVEERVWTAAAHHWDATTRLAATALSAAGAVPSALPVAASAAARRVVGDDAVPQWSPDLPRGGARRVPAVHPGDGAGGGGSAPVAVYFPSCTATMFGAAGGSSGGVREAFLALCERAGTTVVVPDGIASLCCGTPWKSKGLHAGYAAMREQVVPVLRAATRSGALPVVVDASSCTEGLAQLLGEEGVRVVDAVAFTDEVLLPRLPAPSPQGAGQRAPSVVLHPTCSSVQLGLDGALGRVAAAAAEEVVVPDGWGCCAFAGDRGMLHPELTASATAAEARGVAEATAQRPGAVHASLNRTCELGMTRATGQTYRHVIELLEEATRP